MLLFLALPAFALDPLLNGDFEAGDFSDWEAWGDETAVVTTDPYEGTYAARLTLDPSATGFQQTGMYQNILNPVAGEHLQFTVLARMATDDPVTPDGRLVVKWESYNDGGSPVGTGQSVVSLPADGAWSYGKVAVLTPSTAYQLRYTLLFEAGTPGADGTVFVDLAEIGPYVDDFCRALFDQPEDADGDEIGDACDRCPDDADPNDADRDGDDIGDACDLCAGDNATGDTDEDGVCDDEDACLGDDATGDDDEDGVCGDLDLCDGDDALGDDDEDGVCGDERSCGCASGPAPGFAPWLLGLVAILRRRRSGG